MKCVEITEIVSQTGGARAVTWGRTDFSKGSDRKTLWLGIRKLKFLSRILH